jgi:Ca2+-binding RTX toxin-like protein
MKPTGTSTTIANDELPRSKYETREEESSGGIMTRMAFGLVIANAFMMLKDMLYGKPSMAAVPGLPPLMAGLEDAAARPAAPRESRIEDTQSGEIPTEAQEPAAELTDVRPTRLAIGSGGMTIFQNGDHFVPLKYSLGSLQPLPIRGASNDNDDPVTSAFKLAANGGFASSGGGGSSGRGEGSSNGSGDADDDGGIDGDDNNDTGNGDHGDDDGGTRQNRAPTVDRTVYLYNIFISQAVLIGLSQFLTGSADADGDPLSIRNLQVSSGEVVQLANGQWKFTAPPEWLGEVTFTYEITDGEDAVAQTAVLNVVQLPGATITGTDDGETLIGTPGDDIVSGGGGNDIIVVREGNDVVDAGSGDDRVVAGAGNDVVYAGAGNDTVFGGDGNDTLYGGDGNDWISGGAGNDLIFGEGGDDTLSGDEGDDVIVAGDGNDTASDGSGRDLVELGAGDDTALVSDDASNDVFDGGTGKNTIDISAFGSSGINIDLRQGTLAALPQNTAAVPADGGPAVTPGVQPVVIQPAVDTISNFANVIGTDAADVITGNDEANTVTAGGGNDTVDTGAGNDTIVATMADGNDSYDGGEGSDTLDLSAFTISIEVDLNAGTVTTSDGTVDTVTNIENACGGSAADVFVASLAQNDFWGGEGNDVFRFLSSASAGSGSGVRDRIMDFDVGDRVDLDGIVGEFAPPALADAIDNAFSNGGFGNSGSGSSGSGSSGSGNSGSSPDKFTIIGYNDPFTRPGQLKVSFEQQGSDRVALLQGNIDLEDDVDFEIEIHGLVPDDQFHFF